jgi:hypothetical protein
MERLCSYVGTRHTNKQNRRGQNRGTAEQCRICWKVDGAGQSNTEQTENQKKHITYKYSKKVESTCTAKTWTFASQSKELL